MKIKVQNTAYEVLFDEDGIADTITRLKDNKLMVSTHKDCRRILNNIEKLKRGILPDGITYHA